MKNVALAMMVVATTVSGGIAMAGPPVLTVTNLGPGSNFGRSVSDRIDFNGDGFDDLAVGDPSQSFVNVYFGGSGADAIADVVMLGGVTASGLGICVKRVPDINGDGIDELAAGTTRKVLVYFGGTSPDGIADIELPEPAGSPFGTAFGFGLGSADVNGDLKPDLIVGDYQWGPPFPSCCTGRAYVYFGQPTFSGSPDLTFTGEAAGDYFGTCVATGDVNGDGQQDVLVSGPFHANGGRIYTYFGGPGIDAAMDRLCQGVGYLGDNHDVVCGDVNGDHIDDILGGDSHHGVDIFFGGNPTGSTPDLVLTHSGVEFAWGIAVGDYCGDDSNDIVASATESGQPLPGAAYVYRGGAALDNVADDVLTGQSPNRYFGVEVANIGRFRGGPKEEFAIADYNYNGPSINGGHVYLFAGCGLSYMLNVTTAGSGTVTKAPDLAVYPEGTAVTLTATPAPDWHFSSWSGDAAGVVTPWTISMYGTKAILATFEIGADVREDGERNLFALTRVAPNPARRTFGVTFTLPVRAVATLDVQDIAGRRVWFREVGSLGAGTHSLPVDLGSRSLRPGIYVVRLSQEDRSAHRRVAILE